MDFKIGNSKHKIGSKLFPVASKSKLKVFSTENTEKIDFPRYFQALDKIKFETGFCYSNAHITTTIGKNLGYNAEYYCGWMFVGDAPPIHHAWTVLDGKAILDTSMSLMEMMIFMKHAKAPDYRDKIAQDLVEYRKKKLPTSQDSIVGQVPDFLKYVGSPDELTHAKRTFRLLAKDYPNHPSYQRKMNMLGASEMQKKVWGME